MAIAIEDRIGSAAVAKLLGVSLDYLYKARPFLEGFPAGEQVGKEKFYSLAVINTWADGKDVKTLVREGVYQHNLGKTAAEHNQEAVLTLSRGLHAGQFATKKQKKAIAFRRMSAKIRKPQTTTVQVRPEWYL